MNEKNEALFRVGDNVNYKNGGICRIVDICELDYGAGKQAYYVLRSVYENDTTIRVPVNSKAVQTNMRRLLSKEEIDQIILDTEHSENLWVEDYKKRAAAFEQILDSGNRADILWVIKSLSLYRQKAREQKRKFGVTDEKLLEKASKMVLQEISFILDLKQNEVLPYIIQKAQEAQKKE